MSLQLEETWLLRRQRRSGLVEESRMESLKGKTSQGVPYPWARVQNLEPRSAVAGADIPRPSPRRMSGPLAVSGPTVQVNPDKPFNPSGQRVQERA